MTADEELTKERRAVASSCEFCRELNKALTAYAVSQITDEQRAVAPLAIDEEVDYQRHKAVVGICKALTCFHGT